MKKIFQLCKMLFGRGAVPGDGAPVKAFGVELLAGRNPGEGAIYSIRLGARPDFLVNYHVHGLSWKEVRRDLAAIYSLWLDWNEALLAPEVQAELFKVYGALARIDYMDHCAYVPVGTLSRIAIPDGSRCTRLASDQLDGEVHRAEDAPDDGDSERNPLDDGIFHAGNTITPTEALQA